MALRKKIKKSDYEKLNDVFKAEYKENDDGDYILDLEGEEDVTALLNAKNHEKERRLEEARKRRELEKQLEELRQAESDREDALNKKKGDIEAVEKSWQAKYEKLVSEKDSKISALEGHINSFLIDSTVNQIAGEISNAPKLLEPFIRQRLSLDLESDKPKVRVLDTEGNPSALTIDELKSEMKENPDFSQIIIGSQASGGGATAKSNATQAYTGGNSGSPKLSEMGIDALTAYMEAKTGLHKT